jgi:ankyrin repeat protein
MAYGHFDIISLLIERGATPSPKNNKGWSPSDYAFSVEMIEHLHGILSNKKYSSFKNLQNTSILRMHHSIS